MFGGSKHQRSDRERGLVERFAQNDIGLPVQFTWITIPMMSESGLTVELVSWPFLLPYDFAFWTAKRLCICPGQLLTQSVDITNWGCGSLGEHISCRRLFVFIGGGLAKTT